LLYFASTEQYNSKYFNFSYFELAFEIPTSGECFNFDGIDYQLEASKSFDPETDSIIRLASSDCEAMADVNDPESLYIYLFLDLENDLPADSFLLFEVFGIKNPTTTLSKDLFKKNEINKKF